MFCNVTMCFKLCYASSTNQVTGKLVGEINQQNSRQEHMTETATDRMF